MTVAFNPDYLAAGVDAVDTEEVTLSTLDPMKPAVIRAVGQGRLPLPPDAGARALTDAGRRAVIIERLELVDFRNYREAVVRRPTAGTTLVVGDNGQGKTNLVEAMAYLGNARPASAARRPRRSSGSGPTRGGHAGRRARRRRPRARLIEAELARPGATGCRSTGSGCRAPATSSAWCGSRVFSPDDLTLVKGGPGDRRRFLDDTLVALAVKYDAQPPGARPDRAPAQRPAAPDRRPARRRCGADARRLGRQAGRGR